MGKKHGLKHREKLERASHGHTLGKGSPLPDGDLHPVFTGIPARPKVCLPSPTTQYALIFKSSLESQPLVQQPAWQETSNELLLDRPAQPPGTSGETSERPKRSPSTAFLSARARLDIIEEKFEKEMLNQEKFQAHKSKLIWKLQKLTQKIQGEERKLGEIQARMSELMRRWEAMMASTEAPKENDQSTVSWW